MRGDFLFNNFNIYLNNLQELDISGIYGISIHPYQFPIKKLTVKKWNDINLQDCNFIEEITLGSNGDISFLQNTKNIKVVNIIYSQIKPMDIHKILPEAIVTFKSRGITSTYYTEDDFIKSERMH